MNDMGSIKKFMPFTWIFMLIAALSLMGVPPFPGFWSKDAILASSIATHYYLLFSLALITVVITAFYTTRFFGMTFHGEKSENMKSLEKKGAHLGEVHITMVVACGALAVIIVTCGLIGLPLEHFFGHAFEHTLEHLHLPIVHAEHAMPHWIVPLMSVVSVVIGIVPAYLFYFSGKLDPKSIVENNSLLKMLHKFFWNRWYIDSFYFMFFVGGITKLYTFVPKYIESPLDKFFHKIIPSIPQKLYSGGRDTLASRYGQEEVKGAPAERQPVVGISLGYALLLVLLCIALYLIVMLIRGGL